MSDLSAGSHLARLSGAQYQTSFPILAVPCKIITSITTGWNDVKSLFGSWEKLKNLSSHSYRTARDERYYLARYHPACMPKTCRLVVYTRLVLLTGSTTRPHLLSLRLWAGSSGVIHACLWLPAPTYPGSLEPSFRQQSPSSLLLCLIN